MAHAGTPSNIYPSSGQSAEKKPKGWSNVKNTITKTFLVNHITNQRHRLNGLKKSNRRPAKEALCGDFTQHIIYSPQQLPRKVDLRPWMTPVEDQSDINSCTANALAGAYEYLNKRSTGVHLDVSRLFIYYNSRKKSNEKNDLPNKISDEGSMIVDTIETLEESGVCLESIWPYNTKKVNIKPSKNSYAAAEEFTITEALDVDQNLYEMKACLAQGFPIAFGLELYESFDKAETNGGIVAMPKAKEVGRKTHGSHALLAVGYSDTSQAFIVRNSWGKDWGARGYCYIPYQYMTNENFCDELWTVKKLSIDTLGQDQWDDEDTVDYVSPRRGHRDEEEDNDDDDEGEDDEVDIVEVEEEDETDDDGDDDE